MIIELQMHTTAFVTQIAGMFFEIPNIVHNSAETPIIKKVANDMPLVCLVRMVLIV